MFNRYTDKEIKDILNSIVILIDTREQQNNHIIKYFKDKNIKYKELKLDYADYSCMIPANEKLGIYRDMYFDNIISIERKNSLEEISNNFTKGRTQLENEFLRAKGKILLLIENATYKDIINHNYNTKYNPLSFVATLRTFQARYNLDIEFINNIYTGNIIYYTLYYQVREVLKNGANKNII